MFIFNTAIIFKLYQAKKENKENRAGSVTLSKAATGVTIMLVCVSIMFIVFTMPYAIVFHSGIDTGTYKYAVILQLMYLNHSVNIVVYSLTNSRFKKEMIKVLCFWKKNSIQPETDASSSTAITKNG